MTRTTEWVLGIVGSIVAFLGLFVLFAGEDSYIGLGGSLMWQVGDIAPAWGYGMLIGGVVLLAGTGALLLWERRHPREYSPQSERTGLITHIVAFVLVNALLWMQDVAMGGGLKYAYWVTIPWGIGLIVHVIVYFSGGRHATAPKPTA